ncbi:MAG: hypothetical protein HYU52_16875 [Acidobacteria bacterium]|nr:hypothetical protein [Acidobacteriota bacterium]
MVPNTSMPRESRASLIVPRASDEGGPRRVVIVPSKRRNERCFEALATTAERRGLSKIAAVLRQQVEARDFALLESAALAVGEDPKLGSAFVQFAVKEGVLRCRAWVSEAQESRLLEALGGIDGATRIDVDLVN